MKPARETNMRESSVSAPGLRISVAMCTYNGSEFLKEQLNSIAAQSRLPCELVICDDCSSDATPEIVADFARAVSFAVRFLRNPTNLGSTRNFEQAISLCTGDLIALCDQDDIWMPEKLVRQADLLERDPELGGVFSDGELIDDSSQLLGKRLWENFSFDFDRQKSFRTGAAARVLLQGSLVTGATLMIRASSRQIFLPIPQLWVHDAWIVWMLAIYSRIEFIEDQLICYRVHRNQQVGLNTAACYRGLSRRERLKKAKSEEPAKHAALARELEELARRITSEESSSRHYILPVLRQKILFFQDRGVAYNSRLSHICRLLRNLRNYRSYAHGLKYLLRDIALVFA